jgi:hypothetical protein
MSEDGYYGGERKALQVLRSAGSEGTGTAVCSQGGVIPDLLTRLAVADGVAPVNPSLRRACLVADICAARSLRRNISHR